jgi:hypothetical protein
MRSQHFTYESFFFGVLQRGETLDSRYGECRELIYQELTFQPGTYFVRSGLNYNLGFAELLLLIAGGFDQGVIAAVAPRAQLELFTLAAAYGPRVSNQIPRAIDLLRRDPLSRQATLVFPSRSETCSNDNTCTQLIQFLVRGGQLRTLVTMRSWDVVKGVPYDCVMFGGLALAVAHCLGLHPGPVSVSAGSAHIYKDDISKAPLTKKRAFYLSSDLPRNWPDLQVWANDVLDMAPWTGLPPGISWVEVDDGTNRESDRGAAQGADLHEQSNRVSDARRGPRSKKARLPKVREEDADI